MKRRYRVLLNLFSIGLLLFALYLNFIKKEGSDVFVPTVGHSNASPASSSTQTQDLKDGAFSPSDGTLVLR